MRIKFAQSRYMTEIPNMCTENYTICVSVLELWLVGTVVKVWPQNS